MWPYYSLLTVMTSLVWGGQRPGLKQQQSFMHTKVRRWREVTCLVKQWLKLWWTEFKLYSTSRNGHTGVDLQLTFKNTEHTCTTRLGHSFTCALEQHSGMRVRQEGEGQADACSVESLPEGLCSIQGTTVKRMSSMAAHTSNPSTRPVEMRGSLGLGGQAG